MINKEDRIKFPVIHIVSLAAAILTAGCTTYRDAYHLHPELAARVQTTDQKEIERRWGDVSRLIGQYWLSDFDGYQTHLVAMRWLVTGASVQQSWLHCTSTACYNDDWTLQYNPESNAIDYIWGETSTGKILPRFILNTSKKVSPSGELNNWRYEKATNTMHSRKATFHLISEKQAAEAREQLFDTASSNSQRKHAERMAFWDNMSTGMGALSQATAQVSRDFSAQQAQTYAQTEAIQQSQYATPATAAMPERNDSAPAISSSQGRMPANPPQQSSVATASAQESLQARSSASKASNSDDDAMTCTGDAVLSPNPNFKGATIAKVANQCQRSVDMRICLMTRSGNWDCGAQYGVAPGQFGSYWAKNATGETFAHARYSEGRTRQLNQPPGK